MARAQRAWKLRAREEVRGGSRRGRSEHALAELFAFRSPQRGQISRERDCGSDGYFPSSAPLITGFKFRSGLNPVLVKISLFFPGSQIFSRSIPLSLMGFR